MSDGKSENWTASHAAAHEVCTPDIQVVEQSFALLDVMTPGNGFDTTSGLAALAPVEDDASESFRKVIENSCLRVNTQRGPFLYRCIEAAGRVHQQRRAGANHLVSRRDAINSCCGHDVAPLPGKIGYLSPISSSTLYLTSRPHIVRIRRQRAQCGLGDVRVIL